MAVLIKSNGVTYNVIEPDEELNDGEIKEIVSKSIEFLDSLEDYLINGSTKDALWTILEDLYGLRVRETSDNEVFELD